MGLACHLEAAQEEGGPRGLGARHVERAVAGGQAASQGRPALAAVGTSQGSPAPHLSSHPPQSSLGCLAHLVVTLRQGDLTLCFVVCVHHVLGPKWARPRQSGTVTSPPPSLPTCGDQIAHTLCT
ncbi:hypothetical protein F751_3092 [Auxenochlorella protothecoides]|uniref:Uncharacterized protein n=1 Tax=Auxenochlorella protothecoides TaxID=3075 RepID=A0A087SF70_AUXPR|nr:hypothetical protein F751_3092 [Auxenochlorella protothecoides]KFM24374.1 hypothetical protein F751_3092 [Auxenochlorella protothecoides]